MKRTKKAKYSGTVKIMGLTHSATGASFNEVIENLKPRGAHGRAILTVSNGTNERSRILMPAVAYRLFNSQGLTREVALKNLSLMFGL